MSYNLNNLIEEKVKESDKTLESAKWAFRAYGNQNGLKHQNIYAENEIQQIKNFLRQSITEAVEKTLEEVEPKEKDESEGLICLSFNEAISEFRKLKSNWLNK